MPTDDTKIEVTPLPEHGERDEGFQAKTPVSDTAPEPATPAPEQPEASAEPEATETPPPKADADEAHPDAESPETRRERLIDELTGKTDDQEEAQQAPEGTEEPKPEPEAKAPEPTDDDLQEVTNETVRAMKPGEARRKINKLISRVKEAEQLAAGYKEIVDLCQANGFSPEDYKAWVKIGIGLQRGDPQALEAFKFVGQRVGLTPGIDYDAVNKLLDELVERVDVSEEAAEKIRAAIKAPPKAAQAPAQTPPPAPAPAPASPPPQPPPAAQEQLRVQRSLHELERVANKYRQKLGEARWKEIQPALVEAMKPRASLPPEAWAAVYEAEIEKLVAKGGTKPAAAGLRPSSTTGTAKPQFKSERERVIHRLLNEE